MRTVVGLLAALLLLMTVVHEPAFARKQGKERIDSLILRVQTHPAEDSAKVDLYYALSFELYSIDPEKGIRYGEEGVSLGEKIRYKKGLAYCLIAVGVSYWAKTDYPKALEHLYRALTIGEQIRNIQLIAKSAGNLGNVYAELEEYGRAIDFYNKALKIALQIGDSVGIARRLGNIGTIYKDWKDYPRALTYYKEAYKYYVAVGEKRGQAAVLGNIGWVYSEMKRFRESIGYYEQALQAAEASGENRWIMYSYGNMGMDWYEWATDTSTPEQRRFVAQLAPATKKSMLAKAKSYLLKAREAGASAFALESMIDYHNTLAQIYKSENDWENAYDAFKQGRIYMDSLTKLDRKDEVVKLETKRTIELKEKEMQLQRIKLQNADFQRVAFAIGVVLLAVIALLIFIARRKSEKLLLNMLPAEIARRLKREDGPIAEIFDNAAVVFVDIVGFTAFSKEREPAYLINLLTGFFTRVDQLSEQYGMEKIKTIGDSYMAVSGVPVPQEDSVEMAARFAIAVREMMRNFSTSDGHEIRVRLGMDAGSVVAGVIGEKKFSFDLWGDVVNTASRMEAHGLPGEIQVTANVAERLRGKFTLTERGEVEVKGRGMMRTWILQNATNDKNDE